MGDRFLESLFAEAVSVRTITRTERELVGYIFNDRTVVRVIACTIFFVLGKNSQYFAYVP